MQENMFGEIQPKNKKNRKSLKIPIALGKVCLSSKKNKSGFICRGIPYSPNFLNNKHWAIKAKWKKAWEEEVWGRWMEEKPNWQDYNFPLDFKIKLDIFVFCINPQDQDNSYASMKGVIDGLIKCGLIKNDTIEDIKSEIHFVKVSERKAEHLELSISKYK